MLKKNLRVVTALFLIALITFSSITLLNRMGRGLKVDLTEDRIYTLSDETKKIVGGLSHTIRLKLFYSRTEAMKGFDSLRPYNNYFFYIRDLLREYASAVPGEDRPRDHRPERGHPRRAGGPRLRPCGRSPRRMTTGSSSASC